MSSGNHLFSACLLIAVAGCGGGGNSLNAAVPVGAENQQSSEFRDALAATDAAVESSTSGHDSTALKPSTATPVGAYNANILPVIDGSPSNSASWPTWRKSLGRWQWKQIPGTDLSSVRPDPAVAGSLRTRIDAWNGLSADTHRNRLFSAANGGHADYSGNEVYQLDLSSDSPAWTMLRAPTPTAEVVASNYVQGIFGDYYLDGRPASTHTYYALNYLASRDAIFKFGAGSLWGTGNEANWKTDAFSLASNDWHQAGTWPDVVPGSRKSARAASICLNPATEQVYLAAPGNLRRFDPASGQFTLLDSWPDNSTAVTARGCAVDTARNRVVFFGDAYHAPVGGLLYDVTSNTLSRISFTGADAAVAADKGHNFAWYEPKIGQFLLKNGSGDHVYSVDPISFEAKLVVTSGGAALPDAVNGVHTRWQRLPKLGGYAYYPRHGSGVWFLAIE